MMKALRCGQLVARVESSPHRAPAEGALVWQQCRRISRSALGSCRRRGPDITVGGGLRRSSAQYDVHIAAARPAGHTATQRAIREARSARAMRAPNRAARARPRASRTRAETHSEALQTLREGRRAQLAERDLIRSRTLRPRDSVHSLRASLCVLTPSAEAPCRPRAIDLTSHLLLLRP